jgi:hypothetical protein
MKQIGIFCILINSWKPLKLASEQFLTRVINQEARTEVEARLGEEMRRSLREQQAEWERVLRTNREQADQEQRTLAAR